MPVIFNQRDIDKAKIFDRIGYEGDYTPSAHINSLVDDYIDNYHDFIAPSYTYTIKDIVSVHGDRVNVEDSIILKSHKVAGLLKRCDKIAFFALTIGNYLEEMVAYLAENGMVLQSTVLDAIGSSTAEKLASQVEDRVKKNAGVQGMVTSWRFSPGYCDWDVSQQGQVFRALGSNTGGVTLTKSMLMVPRKSVSGIIGIGRPDNEIEKYNPCITCKKKDCPGKRR